MGEEFKAGDVVELKSGGPKMTVAERVRRLSVVGLSFGGSGFDGPMKMRESSSAWGVYANCAALRGSRSSVGRVCVQVLITDVYCRTYLSAQALGLRHLVALARRCRGARATSLGVRDLLFRVVPPESEVPPRGDSHL
jgi:hypothetical protein